MNQLFDAIEQLSTKVESFVDAGPWLPREELLARYEEYSDGEMTDDDVDRWIAGAQSTLQSIVHEAKPYDLPAEFVSFLKLFGGLAVHGEHAYLPVFGMGVKVHTMYYHVQSPEVIRALLPFGFMHIASLAVHDPNGGESSRFHYFLDLAGTILQDGILELTNDQRVRLEESGYKPEAAEWHLSADSFVSWLRRIADSGGKLGHG